MKNLLIFCFFLLANTSFAGTIVIDPDDYDADTNLTNISPYVTISTTNGDAVYCASLSPTAADGMHTQGLGGKVFGGGGWGDEWFYMPDFASPGLEIKFNAPVTHFSLLVAELFWDAGPGSDPVLAYIFDKDDHLISLLYVDEYHQRVDLGFVQTGLDLTWAHWTFEFSAENIGRIIIGGDSEPTTLDRLSFTFVEASEPSTLALMLMGFLLLLFVRTLRNKMIFQKFTIN